MGIKENTKTSFVDSHSVQLSSIDSKTTTTTSVTGLEEKMKDVQLSTTTTAPSTTSIQDGKLSKPTPTTIPTVTKTLSTTFNPGCLFHNKSSRSILENIFNLVKKMEKTYQSKLKALKNSVNPVNVNGRRNHMAFGRRGGGGGGVRRRGGGVSHETNSSKVTTQDISSIKPIVIPSARKFMCSCCIEINPLADSIEFDSSLYLKDGKLETLFENLREQDLERKTIKERCLQLLDIFGPNQSLAGLYDYLALMDSNLPVFSRQKKAGNQFNEVSIEKIKPKTEKELEEEERIKKELELKLQKALPFKQVVQHLEDRVFKVKFPCNDVGVFISKEGFSSLLSSTGIKAFIHVVKLPPNELEIHIKCEKEEDFNTLKKELENKASLLSVKRSIHYHKVEEYQKKSSERFRKRVQSRIVSVSNSDNRLKTRLENSKNSFRVLDNKAASMSHFVKSTTWLGHNSRLSKEQKEEKHEQLRDLAMICSVCQFKYQKSSSNSNSNSNSTHQTCKHHTGFIVTNSKSSNKSIKNHWSCCLAPCSTSKATHESHHLNGCQISKSHVWKKKISNDIKSKSVYLKAEKRSKDKISSIDLEHDRSLVF